MFYEEINMFDDEKPNIFLNKKTWDKMTEAQMQTFKEQIFEYYRSNGFPYYKVLPEDCISKFAKMRRKEYLSLIQDKVVAQTMTGLGELWTYFPHAFDVQCENMLSPLQAFNNDKTLRMAIDKRIKYGSYINDSGMRKALKIATGVQSVSNFRPTAAAAIYDYFDARDVWDMSCGYGGRLLGAFISKSVKHYIGTEPCSPTMDGLINLKTHLNELDPEFKITLHKTGSECFTPVPESLDLCFTSPPYFRTEKYSAEPTQSAIKFPEKESWLQGFLAQTIRNCFIGLKANKFLAINIANVKAYPELESDCIRVAQENGFVFVDTFFYALSKIMGSRNNSASKFKLEPLFIFQKA